MRPIDADELKGGTTNYDEEGNRIWYGWDIDNAPTIEVRDNFDIGYVQGLEDGRKERPHGEWIPVSERLPEIATRYLVQLSDGHITIGEYFSIEKWCLIETSYVIAFPKEVVVAWMPLPEPYKEEAENDI